MKTRTKAQLSSDLAQSAFVRARLEERIRALEEQVAMLEAEKKAAGRETVQAYVTRPGYYYGEYRPCVAVRLRHEVLESVREAVMESVGRGFGNGEMIQGSYQTSGVYEDVVHPDELLPSYVGYLVRCDYSNEEGTSNYRIWGLLPLDQQEDSR